MLEDKVKKILVEFCRILIGCVFIFSGFVKAVDPLGSAYKFHDYFEAFGMPWMDIFTLPASFILSALEFALGVFILLGIYRKFTSIMILLFMLFMTPLTLYLAVANPVSDCGCFGDAFVITNWETFYKNIVLLTAAVLIFLWSKYITPVFSAKSQWLVGLYTFVFILGISVYCYKNLPILDFRPYKVGANIPELMVIPEGAPSDEYKTTFIYEKDGVKKEFDLDNYPADDSTWTFVDSKSELIKEGYKAPVHDFTITTLDGDEITDLILADTSYTFLLISYKLSLADDSDIDNINEINDFAERYGYPFYCLTSSTQSDIVVWTEDMGAEYTFCTTDEITLKTIIRSNPGLVLMKDGKIINKWHHHNLPKNEALAQSLSESSLGQIPPNRDTQKIMTSAFILIVPLLLLFILDFFRYRREKKTEQDNAQQEA